MDGFRDAFAARCELPAFDLGSWIERHGATLPDHPAVFVGRRSSVLRSGQYSDLDQARRTMRSMAAHTSA